MENELKNLKAPKRTEETIERSFTLILTQSNKQTRKATWLHTSIILSAAALFLLLILTSNQFTLFKSTTSSGTEVLSIEAVPPRGLDNKYLTGRGLFLDEKSQERFIHYISQIDIQENVNQTANGPLFKVRYADGKVAHFKLDPITFEDMEFFLTHYETKKYIEITSEDYFIIGYNHPEFSYYQPSPYTWLDLGKGCLKFLLIVAVYSGYLVLAKKASPLARQELRFEFTLKNMLLKLAFLFFVLIVVSGQSYHEYDYYNWVIALGWMAGIFLLRKLKEYLDGNSRRKWREIPLSIFFYMICFLIYIF